MNTEYVMHTSTEKNIYEQLLDDYLKLIQFELIKHKNEVNEDTDQYGIWSLIDRQGVNPFGIEGYRFQNAGEIFKQMDIYIEDIVFFIREQAEEYDIEWFDYDDRKELIKQRRLFPEYCKKDFDYLDMIYNHSEDIDLSKCNHKELLESDIPVSFKKKYIGKKIMSYEDVVQFSNGRRVHCRGRNIGIVVDIDIEKVYMYNHKNPIGYKHYTLRCNNFKKWLTLGLYVAKCATNEEKTEAIESWRKYLKKVINLKQDEGINDSFT